MRLKNRILFWILCCMLPAGMAGQELKVIYARNTRIAKGKTVKTGTQLPVKSHLKINAGGWIVLQNYSGWQFTLTEGYYSVDSCYAFYKQRYRAVDSVSALIKDFLPNDRTAYYKDNCRTDWHERHENEYDHETGNLYFANTKSSVIALEKNTRDTCTIQWRNPNPTARRVYIVVIKNLFGDEIDYFVTDKNYCLLELRNYLPPTSTKLNLILTVYSEDHLQSKNILLSYNKSTE